MSIIYKRLEEVCEILDSRRVPITSKDRKSGIYPYYGANGLQDYVDNYIFDDELVLLAEDGGNFGSKDRPIAYRVSGKCWVNNHAHVLKANADIHVDYLCYSLMFYNTEGLVNGATRQKLTQAAMRQMLVPYREINEQNKIVNELNFVESLITARREQLAKFDELVKSRFVELFGNCKTYAGFEECIEIKDNLRKPISSEERAKMQDGTLYPYYGATGQVGWINAYLSDFEGICIAEDCGNYAAGEASSYIVRGRIWVNNHAHLLKCRENINIYFLNEYFRQADLMDYVNGATRLKLTQSAMKTIPILFPPLELQNEFAAFVEQTDKSKLAIQQSLEKLEMLKKALMQKYFG